MARKRTNNPFVDLVPEVVSLADLKPDPRNPRTHPPEQIDMLAASMRRFGVRSPILARADGTIIYGHGRRLAALSLGLEVYPVVRAPAEWTEADCLAFMIADNQHALNSAWDVELLRNGLLELQALDFDMPALGFDADAMADMFAEPMNDERRVSLADRFLIPPFSVMNAREGWWQARKASWLSLGIQSEVGRGDNLLKFSDSVKLDGEAYNARFKRGAEKGQSSRNAIARQKKPSGTIGAIPPQPKRHPKAHGKV